MKALFRLGKTVATPGALELMKRSNRTAIELLNRHQTGDWGIVDEHDQKVNDNSVKTGARILSAYEIGGEKIWIITEADRSITTILLPSEY